MLPLLTEITIVVLSLTAICLYLIVGLGRIQQFREYGASQLRAVFPYLLLLGLVLVVNSYLRRVGPDLSWIVGWRITDNIYRIEGNFVGRLQEYSHPLGDIYFSAIYIYGYIFMLVFPVVAYLLLEASRPAREAILAYALNYGIGVLCYILFIAYGPRNALPDTVDQILYLHWPESNFLTTQVNAAVNVFPSLHTSLAVTVALLAWRTRHEYPRWVPVAVILALSVAISTMYLGIHWLIDVVAGVGLAIISVYAAAWLTSPNRHGSRIYRIGRRLRSPIDWLTARLVGWIRTRRDNPTDSPGAD